MFEEEGQQAMKQPRCSTFILCGDIDSIAPKSAHYICMRAHGADDAACHLHYLHLTVLDAQSLLQHHTQTSVHTSDYLRLTRGFAVRNMFLVNLAATKRRLFSNISSIIIETTLSYCR